MVRCGEGYVSGGSECCVTQLRLTGEVLAEDGIGPGIACEVSDEDTVLGVCVVCLLCLASSGNVRKLG